MKGLESLKKLQEFLSEEVGIDIAYLPEYELLCEIGKELNALEIIKKYVGVQESYDELFPYDIVDKQYISSGSSLNMTKEEYDLLKEVLK